MKADIIQDVVMKLIGPIHPVGETHTDDKRYENLKVLIELMKELHRDIDSISFNNRNRPEFSMKRAGKFCAEYLDWLGIPK